MAENPADLHEADAIAVYKAVTDPMLELFRRPDGNVDMGAYLAHVYGACPQCGATDHVDTLGRCLADPDPL